jgi:hypothetical protein
MPRVSKWNAILAVSFCIITGATQTEQKLDINDKHSLEAYLTEMERHWAEASGPSEALLLENILADDFLGTNTRGELYTKSEAIERGKSRTRSPNHLDKIKIRFFGDNLAVLHGSESSTAKSPDAMRTVVWTDVWLRRDGRWQSIAAQDMLAALADHR